MRLCPETNGEAFAIPHDRLIFGDRRQSRARSGKGIFVAPPQRLISLNVVVTWQRSQRLPKDSR